MKTCRLCDAPADTLTIFEIPSWTVTDQKPHVEHATCHAHSAQLRRLMETCGWTVTGPVTRLVPLLGSAA